MANEIQAVDPIEGGVRVTLSFGEHPRSGAEFKRFLQDLGWRAASGQINGGTPIFEIAGPLSQEEFLDAAQCDPWLTVPKRLRPLKAVASEKGSR